MIKLYKISFIKTSFLLALSIACSMGSFGFVHVTPADTLKPKPVKYSLKQPDTLKSKFSLKNSNPSIKIHFVPFKPRVIKANTLLSTPVATKDSPLQNSDNKIFNNLKVYPNPVEDQINFSYRVNKEAHVTIKIMDILGNEITTLFSQKMQTGDQVNTFYVASKLNSGFYFVRFVVGNETVIKRISVL